MWGQCVVQRWRGCLKWPASEQAAAKQFANFPAKFPDAAWFLHCDTAATRAGPTFAACAGAPPPPPAAAAVVLPTPPCSFTG